MKEAIKRRDLKAVMEKINQTPYARHLGMEVFELTEGYAKARLAVGDKLKNQFGLLHGGAICSLADQAFAASSNSLGRPAVAITISMNFVSPTFTSKELVAEARIIHRGRTTCVAQAIVSDESGRLVAVFNGTGLFIEDE